MAENEGGAPLDALMAAITDEPLPAGAREDAGFMAEHRSAAADVALLREQLRIIGETLTGSDVRADQQRPTPARPEGPAQSVPGGGRGAGGVSEVGRDVRPGAGGASEAGCEGQLGSAVAPSVKSPAGAARPGAPERSVSGVAAARPPRRARRPAGGPARRPRHPGARTLALGTLAAAVVTAMVVGMGWLIAQGGGAGGASESSAKSAGSAADKASGDGGKPYDPEGELACSSLVVEGTVARVEKPADSRMRVVLTVTRYYRPDKGRPEVTFFLDGGARPAPRPGDHVLIRIPQGADAPTLWAVGDRRVAVNRAWITEALPGAKGKKCTTDDG